MKFSFKSPAERQQIQYMLSDSRFKIISIKINETGRDYNHIYVTAELEN